MAPQSRNPRLSSAALAAAGVLFFLYPLLRPYSDETTLDGGRAMASTAWILAHVFAFGGFILLIPGLVGLYSSIAGQRPSPPDGQRAAYAAVVASWLGVGLLLPYYGAETFGLNAIAQRAVRDNDPGLLELADTVRLGSVPATMFLAGLLLLAAGAILAAVAIWRSGVAPRWSGIPFAVGFALFLPQFFGAPWMRIGHGVLVAVGCVLLAAVLWSRRGSSAAPGARH